MATTTESGIEDLVWLQQMLARHPELASMHYQIAERDGLVSVEVSGANYEARAWRAAINGRITPSYIDQHGVRRQLVIGTRIAVQVVQYPANAA
ncbi:hypothetical protein [Kribbella ginsengisoli]|uniref:Uncharacterized protein n=1 Tax=Kribbella ginsengisoli TaxID=363865 RepID=A0ABP6YE61_9ACTN